MNRRSAIGTLVLGMLLACAGCARHASQSKPASTLTEAQRDSAIARSTLPGARTVGRALELSGRSAARSSALDTLPH